MRVRRREAAGRLRRLASGILRGDVGLPVSVRDRTVLDRLPPMHGERLRAYWLSAEPVLSSREA